MCLLHENLGSINGMYKNELAINFAKKLKIFNNKFINVGVNHLDNKVKKSLNKCLWMFQSLKKISGNFNIHIFTYYPERF